MPTLMGPRGSGAAKDFRTVGRSLGTLAPALDTLKGLLAVTIANVPGMEPEVTPIAGLGGNAYWR